MAAVTDASNATPPSAVITTCVTLAPRSASAVMLVTRPESVRMSSVRMSFSTVAVPVASGSSPSANAGMAALAATAAMLKTAHLAICFIPLFLFVKWGMRL